MKILTETEERKMFGKYRKTKLKLCTYRNGILTYTGTAEDGAEIVVYCGGYEEEPEICANEVYALQELWGVKLCTIEKDGATQEYHHFEDIMWEFEEEDE